MPSTYAHYRFGQQVYRVLPDQIQHHIQNHKDLFDIGLHGPDILFYYRPLFPNRINRIGYAMHNESGKAVFSRFGAIAAYSADPIASFAYIYGFLCHFALDQECHGYIDEKIRESGIRHAEIEVEFDRFLLQCDFKNPLTQSLTDHINPSLSNAGVITKFFDGTQRKHIEKALLSMIFYSHLILAPYQPKRKFVYTLLNITGNDKEMHGLVMNPKPNPNCADSNRKIYALYQAARKKAVHAISTYQNTLAGVLPWDDWYSYTFGSLKKGCAAI